MSDTSPDNSDRTEPSGIVKNVIIVLLAFVLVALCAVQYFTPVPSSPSVTVSVAPAQNPPH